MPVRHGRSRRRVAVLGGLVCVVVAVALLAGVVEAAHRSASYRLTVDQSFAASASALVDDSNATGTELVEVLASTHHLGRVLLESRLQWLAQQSADDLAAATALVPAPSRRRRREPPDRHAEASEPRDRLDPHHARGVLGLTPAIPTGTAGSPPPTSQPVGVPGAERLLKHAGEQLVLADHAYRGLPALFAHVTGGDLLPDSAWTSPKTGQLMPKTLLDDAAPIAADPALAASIRLRIIAVATQPALLPIGTGYPVTPTKEFAVSISVMNAGSSPTIVRAVIRARPIGHSLGHFDSGRASAAVTADGAVALTLPAMDVVPGEHCLVTIDLEAPPLQTRRTGLHWARVVVVGQEP